MAVDCDELVVVGRLKNGEYEHVEIEDDILGHGWITAELRVRSVEKGRSVRPQVPVRYFAHTYMREDRDFMFVLSPEPDGGYLVSTAQLMSYRPRWVNRCVEGGS